MAPPDPAPRGAPASSSTSSGGLVARSVVQPIQRFLETEAAGGVLLLLAAVVALVWANSPWSDAYEQLWEGHLPSRAGSVRLPPDLRHWINDLGMALFFFVVGLEIKREAVEGELRDPRTAAFPIACALGGMVVPAALYAAMNAGGDGASGWGIPMATDIAFSLGVLAVLGSRAPTSLRLFLLTLAIVDDIGAIVVIALFYSDGLSLGWLAAAAGGLAAVVLLRHLRVQSLAAYGVLAGIVWLATFSSGVHATIAGVALGLLTPARPFARRDGSTPTKSPLERLETLLHPWSAYVVLPLFALANAGVVLSSDAVDAAVASTVTGGVVLGLVVGKPIGILLAGYLAVKVGGALRPDGIGWPGVAGAGALAGIGFTVSLFITDLAFEDALADEAKLGILAASLAAGTLGAAVLAFTGRPADLVDRSDRPRREPSTRTE